MTSKFILHAYFLSCETRFELDSLEDVLETSRIIWSQAETSGLQQVCFGEDSGSIYTDRWDGYELTGEETVEGLVSELEDLLDNDDDRLEIAREAGMAFGCAGYNGVMGYD